MAGCCAVGLLILRHACCCGWPCLQWLVTPEAKSAWQQYTNILAQEQAAQAQPSAPGAPTPAAPAAVTPGSTQQQHGQQQSSNLCQPEAADASMPPVKRQRLEPSPTAAEAAVQPPASAVATTDVSGQQVALPARLADVCDTVGAVVVDASGCVAAGVSSGGLALKTEGRVGEAAVIGAGCWAADGTWASVTPTKPGQAQSAAATRAGAGLHPLPGNKTVAMLHAVCCIWLQRWSICELLQSWGHACIRS